VFEGLITVTEPADSWVARWQRLEGYVGGVYACKVVGTVSVGDFLLVEEEGGVGRGEGVG
jgi:transcription elongation factor SPT4